MKFTLADLIVDGKINWKKLPKKESDRLELLKNQNIPTEFKTTPEKLWYLYHKCSRPRCLECGNITSFLSLGNGFAKFCSNSCQSKNVLTKEKRQNTSQKNFGVSHPSQSDKIQQKIKQTCFLKYGTEHPMKNEVIREKARMTNIELRGVSSPSKDINVREKLKTNNLAKYGVEHILQVPEVRHKIEQTNIQKYGHKVSVHGELLKTKIKKQRIEKHGVEHTWQIPEVKLKTKDTIFSKYGVDHLSKDEEWQKQRYKAYQKTIYKNIFQRLKKHNVSMLFSIEEFNTVEEEYNFECDKCKSQIASTLRDGKIPRCFNCHPIKFGKKQLEFYHFIMSVYSDVTCYNDRKIIAPKELDVVLPNLKLAFEFNGTFWHSPRFKKANYHEEKTQLAHDAGYLLIHVWEHEWDNNREKIENKIRKIINERTA